jgi:hypothetical protein
LGGVLIEYKAVPVFARARNYPGHLLIVSAPAFPQSAILIDDDDRSRTGKLAPQSIKLLGAIAAT